jgi:hypothetical protein
MTLSPPYLCRKGGPGHIVDYDHKSASLMHLSRLKPTKRTDLEANCLQALPNFADVFC